MLVVVVAVVLVGCAHDVKVEYPHDPREPTGTVILAFTQPADGVTVAINGLLVVDREHTGHVRIDGIPTGTVEIAVAAGPTEKQFKLWVTSDNPTTVPLGQAGQSLGDTLKGFFASIVTVVLYSILR